MAMFEGLADPQGHLLFSRRLKAAQIQLSSSELKIKGINDGRPIPLDGFLLLRKVDLLATGDASVINWTWDMQSLIDARNAGFPVGNPYIIAVEQAALLELKSMIGEDGSRVFQTAANHALTICASVFQNKTELEKIDTTFDPFSATRYVQRVEQKSQEFIRDNKKRIREFADLKASSWQEGSSNDLEQHIHNVGQLELALKGTSAEMREGDMVESLINSFKKDSRLTHLTTHLLQNRINSFDRISNIAVRDLRTYENAHKESEGQNQGAFMARIVSSGSSSPSKVLNSIAASAKCMSPNSFYAMFTGGRTEARTNANTGPPATNLQQQLERANQIIESRGALIKKLKRQVRQAGGDPFAKESSQNGQAKTGGGGKSGNRRRKGKGGGYQQKDDSNQREVDAQIAHLSRFNVDVIDDKSAGAESPVQKEADSVDSSEQHADSMSSGHQATFGKESSGSVHSGSGWFDTFKRFAMPLLLALTLFASVFTTIIPNALKNLFNAFCSAVRWTSKSMFALPMALHRDGSLTCGVIFLVLALAFLCHSCYAAKLTRHSPFLDESNSMLQRNNISGLASDNAIHAMVSFKNGSWLPPQQAAEWRATLPSELPTPSNALVVSVADEQSWSLDVIIDGGAS